MTPTNAHADTFARKDKLYRKKTYQFFFVFPFLAFVSLFIVVSLDFSLSLFFFLVCYQSHEKLLKKLNPAIAWNMKLKLTNTAEIPNSTIHGGILILHGWFSKKKRGQRCVSTFEEKTATISQRNIIGQEYYDNASCTVKNLEQIFFFLYFSFLFFFLYFDADILEREKKSEASTKMASKKKKKKKLKNSSLQGTSRISAKIEGRSDLKIWPVVVKLTFWPTHYMQNVKHIAETHEQKFMRNLVRKHMNFIRNVIGPNSFNGLSG